MSDDRWLLPEGIEDIVAPRARRMESLRRQVLDLLDAWGYDLVQPPLIEFLDSLLTGTGHGLDLYTFKLTDQLSGRLLGVRADITPQTARIDASRLRRDGPVRLCYVGTVLKTRADAAGGSRSPVQIGAELFGHGGLESDLEIVSLLLETLGLARIDSPLLDIGHVGIYRALARLANLAEPDERELFDILQRKAVPDLAAFLDGRDIRPAVREALAALVELHGDPADVIALARQRLAVGGDEVTRALAALDALCARLTEAYPGVGQHLDLAELRGYRYHTGMVYAAFVPGHGREVARGGRYDDVGAAFGRARPATGFSADLGELVRLGAGEPDRAGHAVLAPADDDSELHRAVRALRREGRRVVRVLPGMTEAPAALGCREVLVREGERWVVRAARAAPDPSAESD